MDRQRSKGVLDRVEPLGEERRVEAPSALRWATVRRLFAGGLRRRPALQVEGSELRPVRPEPESGAESRSASEPMAQPSTARRAAGSWRRW